MTQALINGRVLTDDGFATGLAVLVDGARIAAVVPAAIALEPALGAVQAGDQLGDLPPRVCTGCRLGDRAGQQQRSQQH